VRLAHPIPEFHPTLQPWSITAVGFVHPGAEIVRADPARVELREEREKVLHFDLMLWIGGGWVGRSHGVEKGPGTPAKSLDVRWTVGRDRRVGRVGVAGCGSVW
jgi:hypothetical protein